MNYDLIVIGAGPAGLAAALEAEKNGVEKILLIERDNVPGGILNQCIHNGFGLHWFKEELTGPEYAKRFVDDVSKSNIELMTDTMALQIAPDKSVYAVNSKNGYMHLNAKAIILSMGCRERTRGAISIPGERPSGIFTAGTAQRYINIEGYMVGKRAVILGSGDIGLIMARRLTLEGAKVLACVEIMPYSNGLTRNVVQCLDDFDIPLYLSHTVVDIRGRKRLEKVTIARVDENRNPIPGTEIDFDCDTLLLSVGLIPENELTRGAGILMDGRTGGAVVSDDMQTSVPGLFACGNVVHVHDLVDFVTAESNRAGKAAAEYIKGVAAKEADCITVEAGAGVIYTVPGLIRRNGANSLIDIFFRVNGIYEDKHVTVKADGKQIANYKRDYLLPAEMVSVKLPRKLILAGCGRISIAIED